MTREELLADILKSEAKDYIFQLATSVGKTMLCLSKIASLYPHITSTTIPKTLIVVPYKNLMGNHKDIKGWYAEFVKWGYSSYLPNVTFTCYSSLHKHAGNWDVVVLDEAHHTSERCQELLKQFSMKHLFVLSATLSREHIWFFKKLRPNIKEYRINIIEAIQNNILPEPKIILLPLALSTNKTLTITIKNPKKPTKKPLLIDFKDRFNYKSYNGKIIMRCSPMQYSLYLDNLIEWASRNNRKMMAILNGGKRIKLLAEHKTPYIKSLLQHLDNHRTLTFCGSIENAVNLGYPRVDSTIGTNALDDFNNKIINHLSCIEMLDEGANINDCKIGIFQIINPSSRMTIQRAGKLNLPLCF